MNWLRNLFGSDTDELKGQVDGLKGQVDGLKGQVDALELVLKLYADLLGSKRFDYQEDLPARVEAEVASRLDREKEDPEKSASYRETVQRFLPKSR